MKLLFSITYYHPYVSGLTICVKRLAEHFAQKHAVSILTLQDKQSLLLEESINTVKVTRAVPLLKINKGFLSWDFIIKSFKLVQQHDVIVINLPQVEGIIPALFGRLLGKRVVTIYHCEVQLPQGIINSIIQGLLEVSHRLTLTLSHRIVTYTHDYRDHSRLLKPYRHKTICILPPVPAPHIDDDVKEQLLRKIGKTDIVIGVASRLAAEKGIEFLLEAIPMLSRAFKNKRITIVMAGPLDPVGEGDYKKKIFTLVKNHAQEVVFLGSLSQHEMGAFYSLLDVLVLPSINSTEAFGLVQVEAMLIGVPVVASELFGVREPIRLTGMGKVVSPRNIEKLASAIVDVITHKNDYLKSKSSIQDIFSLTHTYNKYREIFEGTA